MKYKNCSFCGRNENEVLLIAEGLNAVVCQNCVDKLSEYSENFKQMDKNTENDLSLFSKNNTHTKKNKISNPFLDKIKTPNDIKTYLDNFVIGQNKAKKVLSVAVYNHYKKIYQKSLFEKLEQNKKEKFEELKDVDLEKSNVVLIGSTGTGKTLLAKTISKLLDVPFAIADATVFTEAGYVGEDVETILTRLLQASNYDVELAEKGIVYIDEIDKISRKQGANPSITKDVGGEGVQQAMLKLLEGSIVMVPPQGGRKHPEQKLINVNTEKILFICGGAFDGIDKIIARRINTNSIGFNKNKDKNEEILNQIKRFINTQDLKSFGLIPELLGRLPVVVSLDDLDANTLKQILIEPKNSLIKQYKKLFLLENIELIIEDNVLDFIVNKALEYNIGARGLRSICECILLDPMFNNKNNKQKTLIITLDYAKEKFENNEMSFYKQEN